MRTSARAQFEQLREMKGAHTGSSGEFFHMNIAIEIGVDKLQYPVEARLGQPSAAWLRGFRTSKVGGECVADHFTQEATGRSTGFDVGFKDLHHPRNLWIPQVELRSQIQRSPVKTLLQTLRDNGVIEFENPLNVRFRSHNVNRCMHARGSTRTLPSVDSAVVWRPSASHS